MTGGLLAGVRVVEHASLLTGAATGLLLADLGADVVKVESPVGDLMRYALGQIVPGHSPAHLQLNRNKRGVTINLADPQDAPRWRALIAGADVLIDAGAVGSLAKHGYDDEALAALNPGLIRCTVSGFGASGPCAKIPAHGLLMGAVAGAYPSSGTSQGAVVDGRGGSPAVTAANAAALAITAALYRREKTGRGAVLDVSATDALLAAAMVPVAYAANDARIADRSSLPVLAEGSSGPRYTLYDTADGHRVAFAALEPAFWKRFCLAVDRADLIDAGYDGDELSRELTAIMSGRSLVEWLNLAVEHRLSIAPAHHTVDDLRGDPQLQTRSVFVDTVHPVAGRFTAVGSPLAVDGQGFTVNRPAPQLGEHNAELADGWT